MALSAFNWLLVFLVIVGEATADQQCFPQHISSFKFRLTSYSNLTGLRFFTVGLESEARSEGPVVLDVNHWTEMCRDTEMVGVQVDVTTPTHPPTKEPLQTTATSPTTTTERVTQTTPKMPSPAVTTAKPVAGCWSGYELLPGVGCYKDVKKGMTWQQANDFCAAEGAHLAVPKTQEQMNFFTHIKERPGSFPWVGIHKTGEQWISVQGSVFPLKSSFWHPGRPSSFGSCVGLGSGGLADWKCSDIQRSICQQP